MGWPPFIAVRKDAPAVASVHVGTAIGNERSRRTKPFKALFGQAVRPVATPDLTAKRAARTLKPLDAETAHSPFPHDPAALGNMRPDQVPRFLGAVSDPSNLPVKTVRLGSLTALQNRVDPKKVEAFRSGDVKTDRKPAVVHMQGRNYIADGHHRLSADYLDGKATSDVHYLDLEPVSNALKRAAGAAASAFNGKPLAFDIDGVAPTWSLPYRVAKADPDKRLIFGWASVVEKDGQLVIDKQGDIILPGDLEDAVYDYVLYSREGGDLHSLRKASRLVESMMFTKEKQVALGIDLGQVGWWSGFFVDDDGLWAAHKRGERPEFSIGGAAVRQEV